MERYKQKFQEGEDIEGEVGMSIGKENEGERKLFIASIKSAIEDLTSEWDYLKDKLRLTTLKKMERLLHEINHLEK